MLLGASNLGGLLFALLGASGLGGLLLALFGALSAPFGVALFETFA